MPGVLSHSPKNIPELLKSGSLKVAVAGYGGFETPLAYAYGRIGARVSIVDMDACSVESFVNMIIGSRYASAISRFLRSGIVNIASDRIKALTESDVIDVFAPIRFSELGQPDYSMLHKLSEEVGRSLGEGKLIISSTITPPGMTEDVIMNILEKSSGLKVGDSFGLAYSPYEPLPIERSDSTIRILAAVDRRSLDIAEAIISTVYGGRILKIDNIRYAEAIKLFDSASKYILYTFTYELLEVCGKLGLDHGSLNYALEVLHSSYSLLPVWSYLSGNTRLLLDLCEAYKFKPRILNAALKVGEGISRIYLSMVREAARQIGKPLRKCRVALIGLSDRAYTCEGVVSSPTIDLALRLRKIGAFVKVFDPYRLSSKLDKVGIKISRRLEECLEDTDIIVILPESKVMKTIMMKKLGVAKALAQTSLAIIDLAGVIDRVEASRLGFIYVGLDGALHAG